MKRTISPAMQVYAALLAGGSVAGKTHRGERVSALDLGRAVALPRRVRGQSVRSLSDIEKDAVDAAERKRTRRRAKALRNLTQSEAGRKQA